MRIDWHLQARKAAERIALRKTNLSVQSKSESIRYISIHKESIDTGALAEVPTSVGASTRLLCTEKL